jgi:hypothetical protein
MRLRPLHFGNVTEGLGWKMSSEDAIVRCQVLILEQQFLIDQAYDVGLQASPFVVCHAEHPSYTRRTRVDKLTTRGKRWRRIGVEPMNQGFADQPKSRWQATQLTKLLPLVRRAVHFLIQSY